MLKTFHFLQESFLFNIFLGFSLFLVSSTLIGQVSEHGADFELKENLKTTSAIFESITSADSINTQLKGTIKEVCQAKGCWMKVNLADNQEVFVRFKNYGFFVPTDAAGKEVVLNGRAFLEEMTVDDQRHYAKDKGATDKEIAKITEPKRTLRFEADGVRISGKR